MMFLFLKENSPGDFKVGINKSTSKELKFVFAQCNQTWNYVWAKKCKDGQESPGNPEKV